MKKMVRSKTIYTSETKHDKEIAEHFGWNWSDNQKRLVKKNIEPIIYDGKQMYTDGIITTDNPAILAATKHYEICLGGYVWTPNKKKFKKLAERNAKAKKKTMCPMQAFAASVGLTKVDDSE